MLHGPAPGEGQGKEVRFGFTTEDVCRKPLESLERGRVTRVFAVRAADTCRR